MDSDLSYNNPIVWCIAEQESHHNADAVGDGGEAVGILQIHRIMVRDANRILNESRYTYDDRYSPEKSLEIFWIYVENYAPVSYDRVVTENWTLEDFEIIARMWNGGPKGHLKDATIKYWNQVFEIYEAHFE